MVCHMAVGSNSLPARAPIFTRISVVAERKITVQSLVGRRSSARGSGSTYTRSVHEIRHQELLAGKVCTARTQIHGREQRAASLTLMRGCRACDFCVLEHWYRDSKNNYIVVWWPLFRYCETRDNDLVLLSACDSSAAPQSSTIKYRQTQHATEVLLMLQDISLSPRYDLSLSLSLSLSLCLCDAQD